MTTVLLPQVTDNTDNRYFLEPLNASAHILRYLESFPDALYSKSVDSHFVRFMYVLLGPVGVGWLRDNLTQARLELEASGISLGSLDNFYGDPFSFGRILSEYYEDDTSGLLPASVWETIQEQDEAYRTRAIEYMNAARLGTSPEGMRLCASSGIGQECDVVENYRYLFDSNSDDPLGIPYYGNTMALGEFIVIPRPTISRSEQQLIDFIDAALPLGANNYTLAFNGWSVTLDPLTTGTTGAGKTASDVQSALWGLHSIGPGNVVVAGGPAPLPFLVTFTGQLSNQNVPTLSATFQVATFTATALNGSPTLTSVVVTSGAVAAGQIIKGPGVPTNTVIDSIFGSAYTLSENYSGINHSQLHYTVYETIPVKVATGVLDPSTETVVISDADRHSLQVALDYLRPVASYPTYRPGSGTLREQEAASIESTSEYVNVVRYVTGSPTVSWPSTDNVHWIEASIENEAPTLAQGTQQHYVGFHNVQSVTAYTDQALLDPNYANTTANLSRYASEHVGPFPEMRLVMPFFNQFSQSYTTAFTPDQALADYPELLAVSTQTDTGVALINNIYPADYLNAQGVPDLVYTDAAFWASRGRTEGAEILEIDLGSPQAVNYISLELTRKPVIIEVDYDTLDLAPERNFIPVVPMADFPTTTALFYDPSQLSPWETLAFYFNDGIGMIYTRFIRLTFTRRADAITYGRFLYNTSTQTQLPWSIDVRNLRIGRNVAPSV